MSVRRGKMSILLVIIVVLGLLTASCGGAAAPTPMTVYESTEHGFSIEYPEGWTGNALEAGVYFAIDFRDPEGNLCEEVSVEYKTEEADLDEVVSEAITYMEAMPQFELISEGDIVIGQGIPGHEIAGKGDIGTGKVEKFRYVALVRGKQVFFIGVRGEPSYFGREDQTIDAIIDSFELLPTYTFVHPTPGPGDTYTNAEFGFSINYPAGWMEAPTGYPGEVMSFATLEGLPSVMIRAWPVDEGTTLATATSDLSQDLAQHVDDYELAWECAVTLDDGTPAYEIVFSGIMEGYVLKCKCVLVIQGANAFLMQGFSLLGSFELDESAIDEVIHSFHLE